MSIHLGEQADDRVSTGSTTSQSYGALVWRRFRKSTSGMVGLTLVTLLLLIAFFADFFAIIECSKFTVSCFF